MFKYHPREILIAIEKFKSLKEGFEEFGNGLVDKYPFNAGVVAAYLDKLVDDTIWTPAFNKMYANFVFVTMDWVEGNGFVDMNPYLATLYPFSNKQIKLMSKKYFESRWGNETSEIFTRTDNVKNQSDKIVVAVFSPHLLDHAFGYLIVKWISFQNNTNSNVEIICLSLANDDKKEDTDHSIQQDIRSSCRFFDVSKYTLYKNEKQKKKQHADLADFIKQLGVDIILDCCGFNEGSETGVLVLKPAPIIVNFTLGVPGTIGSTVHDYIMLDPIVAPLPQSAHEYWEKVVHVSPSYFFGSQLERFKYMKYRGRYKTSKGRVLTISGETPIPPNIYQFVDALWECSDQSCEYEKNVYWRGKGASRKNIRKCNSSGHYVVTTRSEYDIPDDKVVFGSFNLFWKIIPETVHLWVQILEKVPESVMLVCEYPAQAVQNLRQYLVSHYSPEISSRFLSTPYEQWSELHLLKCGLVDLFLDSFPCGGHTTTLDALVACVPVISKIGTTLVGRVPASLLNAIGLTELIVDSCEDYIELGIKLGNDKGRLQQYSIDLVDLRLNCPLLDPVHFSNEMIRIFTRMDENYKKGTKTHITAPCKFSSDSVKLYDVTICDEIGRGSTAIIHSGKFRGKPVAVKVVRRKSKEIKQVGFELELHRQLNHMAIVKLLAACAEEDALLIMELCRFDLKTFLCNNSLTIKNASRFAIQLIDALAYVHGRDIIHRDVKNSNCLVHNSGNLKLCDFGNSVKSITGSCYGSSHGSFVCENIAPEIRNRCHYSVKSDVYAAAVTIAEFYIGSTFQMDSIHDGLKTHLKDHPTIYEYLRDMLNEEPTKRPSCKDLTEQNIFFVVAGIEKRELYDVNPDIPVLVNPPNNSKNGTTTFSECIMSDTEKNEHSLEMTYFSYDILTNKKNRVGKIGQGSRVTVHSGIFRGENGTVLEMDNNVAVVELTDYIPKVERRIPTWLLQME